jgi:arylsulfatase A-like enzyme
MAIPASIWSLDLFVRWGARPLELLEREAPENVPVSMMLSLLLWWAIAALVEALDGRARRIAAGVVGGLAASLLVSLWNFRLLRHHDIGRGTIGYFLEEPLNALSLGATGFSALFVLAVFACAALWTGALLATRMSLSRLLRGAALVALLGWGIVCSGLQAPQSTIVAPFVSDVHLASLTAASVALRLGHETAVLERGARTEIEPTEGAVGDGGELPNIVIFVGESMRRDHMSAHGYHRDSTPHLRRFMEAHPDEVYDFERAISTSSYTPVALATLLLGQYQGQTRDSFHRAPVLWQYLHALGGRSFLVATQRWSWANLDRFFLEDHPPHRAMSADDFSSPIVNDTGIDDRIAAQRFVEMLVEEASSEAPFLGVFQANSTHYPLLVDEEAPWSTEGLVERYDAALRVTDAALGMILEALVEEEILDDTVVIVLSDHADFLRGDRLEEWAMGPDRAPAEDFLVGERIESCHPLVVRVPMVVFVPERLRRRLGDDAHRALRENRSRVVSPVDLFETILAMWGHTRADFAPDIDGDGHSLLRELPEDRRALCLTTPGWTDWKMDGVAIYGDAHAVYAREDFAVPRAFDMTDPEIFELPMRGARADSEALQWARRAGDHPDLQRVRERLPGRLRSIFGGAAASKTPRSKTRE